MWCEYKSYDFELLVLPLGSFDSTCKMNLLGLHTYKAGNHAYKRLPAQFTFEHALNHSILRCPARTGDFLRTVTDAEDDMQLFWEAFPAEGGKARTTYLFAYCDTDRQRPSIEVKSL